MSTRWPDKTVIGLTGNIATGKSVVRRMLEHLGAFGIDADGLVHRAMSPGAPAYKPIVETFGKWILDGSGRINRDRLGTIVFTIPEGLILLEQITHPIIRHVLDILIRRSDKEVVVIEAIKLIESGMVDNCDVVWVVDASPEVQLHRLTSQRGMDKVEAQKRVSAQGSQSDKLARADKIINNAGGYEDTYNQVEAAFNALVGVEEEEVVEAAPELEVAPPAAVDTDAEIQVQRGGPKQAEAIARFLNQMQDMSLSRTDVMVRFGQKAYMLAYAGNQIVGLAGWQVENLIARVDEFMLLSGTPADRTVKELVESIEQAANDLQSEIALIFLSKSTVEPVKQALLTAGYEVKAAAELRVPDWREAAEQASSPDTTMVFKRLREDRVLKPI